MTKIKSILAIATIAIATTVTATPSISSQFASLSDMSIGTEKEKELTYQSLKSKDRDLYDIEVYKNYIPGAGDHADLAQRVKFKMIAPQYFKKHNLAWKNPNASYWKK